ncbi:MAG: DUF3298 and DUF4163 domain-containing protein [Thiofilum sp.]|uniref:DUF3298 and DUF4163 domain-containing protein n=1 Tax=Thiofilum sp. TaxID=2212733 RepID=UPI0025CB79BC|nr:DUF3298 and DUF4163 domain-containing protein [Thiofilum sp.]MBK8452636.1 DUF3298 and DUF4163 domain-containing protein [Thiofilum sp.]
MRRLANSVVLIGLFSATVLTGCNSTDTAHASNLDYQTISYQKQGGKACPAGSAWNSDESALCASVKILYPQLNQADANPIIQQINQFIGEETFSYETEDGKQAKTAEELASLFIDEYLKQPEVSTPWTLERSIAIVFSTDAILTLKFSEYSYMGGAHPASGQSYYTLNRHNGKPYKLSDLLNNGYEDELNIIGERIFRADKKIPADQMLTEAGYEFPNGNFALNSNFAATQEGLVFYFNSYEIAPYALGPTELTIPYQDIPNLIRADGPLAAFKPKA